MRRLMNFVPSWAAGRNQRKEISDDLLRHPATKSRAQSAVQSAARGAVQFANGTALWRLAQHVFATGDRRLWTGASTLWPAKRPKWRVTPPPPPLIKPPRGGANTRGGATTATTTAPTP